VHAVAWRVDQAAIGDEVSSKNWQPCGEVHRARLRTLARHLLSHALKDSVNYDTDLELHVVVDSGSSEKSNLELPLAVRESLGTRQR
jgi:hypothetical protein